MPHARPEPVTIRPDHYERLRENTHILYRCFNRKDVLLYVGMTNNPEERFKQHRADKPWWNYVHYLTLQEFPTRRALAEAEAIAIQTESPTFNAVIPRGYDNPPRFFGQARRLWPEASTFCTAVPEYGHLIDMTLEQQLYPCVECHARAIYNEGDAVICGLCSSEWTFDVWFDMTFNAAQDTPHQMRLL